MDKEVEIAQVNELKFYLNWNYVKDICNEAVRKENDQLRKFFEEFNALNVVKENEQLKELLKEIIADADLSYCDSDIELRIDNAIGEKK